MRQYDIVHVGAKRRSQLAIILQSDLTDHAPTVIIAPIRKVPKSRFIPKLNIPIEAEGAAMQIVMDELAAVPRSVLGDTIENREELHSEIMSAIDLLFAGI